MKNFYIAITFLCAALIAFLVLIACALTDKPEEPQAVAPEMNAEGLCTVTVKHMPQPTEGEILAMAQAMSGECYENEYDDEAFDEPEEKQAAGKSNRTSSKKDDFDIDFVDL